MPGQRHSQFSSLLHERFFQKKIQPGFAMPTRDNAIRFDGYSRRRLAFHRLHRLTPVYYVLRQSPQVLLNLLHEGLTAGIVWRVDYYHPCAREILALHQVPIHGKIRKP